MAIEPVVIRFAAAGVNEVGAAFARVGSQVRKFEEAATRERERGARTRSGVTRGEEREQQRAYQKIQAEAERAERRKTKDAEAEAKRREAIVRKSSEYAGKLAEKQANEEIREAERARRAVEREEERKLRVRIRSSELAGRAAAREAAEEARAVERSARRRAGIGGRVADSIGGSVRGVLGGAVMAGGAALGIGGGIALVDAARQQMSAERSAALLANSATIGGVAPAGANVQNILGQATAASKAYGVDKGELIGAVQNYVAKSSDFAGGMENMGFFAKLSAATGARLEDITGAAGILRAQNKDLGKDDMKQMLLDMTEQGKQGAVEISDLASQAGKLGSTRGSYAGNVADNQRKLLALAQISRTETGSAEDAATDVADIAKEGLKNKAHVDRMRQWGVKFDKNGRISDVQQMIEASLLATGGNSTELNEQYGLRGGAVFNRLAPIFQKAGGGDKGIAAVRGELDPIMNARGSQAQLDQMYEQVANTPSKKIEMAFNSISQTLQAKLEPRLEHFATDTLPKLEPIFEKALDAADHFASWFAANPLTGLGTVVLAAVTKDLASAGIGMAVKALIESMFRNGGGFGAVPPGVGGAAGKVLGAVGTVAAVGAAAYGAAQAIDADVALQQMGGASRAVNLANSAVTAGELRRNARAGKLSAQDVAKAQADAAALSNRVDLLKKGPDLSLGEKIAHYGTFGLAGIKDEKEALNRRELEATTKALQELQKAIADVAKAVPKIPPVQSHAPQHPIADRPVH